MTWRKAICEVLEDSPEPLHYAKIAEEIASNSLKKNIGATPARTVNGMLTDSIKSEGDSSPFIKITKGIYALRKQGDSDGGSVLPNSLQKPMQEEPKPILTSFGMFWRRINVDWKSTPQFQLIFVSNEVFTFFTMVEKLFTLAALPNDRWAKGFSNIQRREWRPDGIGFLGLVFFPFLKKAKSVASRKLIAQIC